jgi:hypothetical protein
LDSFGKVFAGFGVGQVIENPRNLEVIKQFVGSIKTPDGAKATYKQNIMEGQGIDE